MAADVCKALDLGLKNGSVSHHLFKLQTDEKRKAPSLSDGEVRKGMLLVSESGLYRLVMRSDKPDAKWFQDWVAREVLSAIRKDGGYIAGQDKLATGEMFLGGASGPCGADGQQHHQVSA